MMTTRRIALGSLCALAALVASATLAAQARERVVFVSALDRSGVPVAELTPDDIVVREDNVAREVLRIAPATDPMQIALLVDNSSAAEALVGDYRRALPPFIEALAGKAQPGQRNEIALIALADRPTILADYTPDAAQVIKAAERLFSMPSSGTYLLDAIIETSRGIVRRGSTRPVIVAIVTDGPDLSNRQYSQVLDPLEESGATLHVVAIGPARNDDYDRSYVIDRGTRDSGGSYHNLLTGTALEGHLQKLAAQLTRQFRVTYARPDTLIPPEDVKVESKRDALVVRGTPERQPEGQRR
jgi:hypothetical protein